MGGAIGQAQVIEFASFGPMEVETIEQDLFRSWLDQIIDMKHALVKLARNRLSFSGGEVRVYTDKPGHPPLPARLEAGASPARPQGLFPYTRRRSSASARAKRTEPV
jgi:hypothetical protein